MKCSSYLSCTILMVTAALWHAPDQVFAQCACNADVNDDGVVTILDGICILDCYQNDDCSCCVNSCDVNCDGVVDELDAHQDLVDVDSTWLCLFEGGSAAQCCGPTGACCDTLTGACQDGVSEGLCTGKTETWTEGAFCSRDLCPLPPIGACCQR